MPVDREPSTLKVVVTYPAARSTEKLVTALVRRGLDVFVSGPTAYLGAPPASMVDVICTTSVTESVGSEIGTDPAVVVFGPGSVEAEGLALSSGAIDYIDVEQSLDVTVA